MRLCERTAMTEDETKKCDALFEAAAARVEAWPNHWITGADIDDYCYECAVKRLDELKQSDPTGEYILDGGWSSESDSTPFCGTCDKLLDGSLTQCGCESEIEHFMEYPVDPKSDDDLRAMSEVISSSGWMFPEGQRFESDSEKERLKEYYKDLHQVGLAFLKKLRGEVPDHEIM